uniref:General transcription factor IIH subunit 4 n=1 Tax=Macrostomum lignano TaxID=282301 RepID=A0A1I8HXV2_9PLAT
MVKAMFEFLSSLDLTVINKIYSNSYTVTSLFSELPTLGKHLLVRLLFIPSVIPKKVVLAWFTKEAQQSELPEALKVLERLRILESVDAAGGMASYRIKPEFQESLRRGLQGGGQAWYETGSVDSAGSDKGGRSIEQLDQFAKEHWDSLLQFMVNSRELERGKVSKAVEQLLVDSGLCVPGGGGGGGSRGSGSDEDDDEDDDGEGGGGGGFTVGESGFRFLLLDQATQVQTIVVHFLRAVQKGSGKMAGIDLSEAINLLFQLSSATLGRSYPTACLPSPSQQSCLRHCRALGLVYWRKRYPGRFYPTRLATRATSGRLGLADSTGSADGSGGGDGGYLIVETNFRVFAFTNSPLQMETRLFGVKATSSMVFLSEMDFLVTIGLKSPAPNQQRLSALLPLPSRWSQLSSSATRQFRMSFKPRLLNTLRICLVALVALFTQPLYRFPNLFCGHITRQSVADALSHGITARQLLSFMTASAHPQLRQRQLPTVLPPTVCDQMLLWERERNRFTFTDSVLYEKFANKRDYQAVKSYASDCGVLLHSVDDRMILVVTNAGHDDICRFYKRYKQESARGN